MKEEILAVSNSALEIRSRTDGLEEEIRVVREANLVVKEEVGKLCSKTEEIMVEYKKVLKPGRT